MQTLFALVVVITMANGDKQDAVMGVFESEMECNHAMAEQGVKGDCWPVDGILSAGEKPATLARTE